MSIKAETLDKNSERYTEGTEFKKISSAILKTYGQDEGLSIIIHLIHEIEKPAEKQIEYLNIPNTYPINPASPYGTGSRSDQAPLWDWTKVTCDGNNVEMPKVPTLNGPYVYSGPVPDIKLGTDVKFATDYTTASAASSSAKDANTTITNATSK